MTSLFYNKMLLDDFLIIEFEAESKDPEKLCNAILDTLENAEITAQDIERCKKMWIAYDVRLTDNIESIAAFATDSILNYGKIIDNRVDFYREMNVKEFEKVRKSIDFSNHAIVLGFPDEKKKKKKGE